MKKSTDKVIHAERFSQHLILGTEEKLFYANQHSRQSINSFSKNKESEECNTPDFLSIYCTRLIDVDTNFKTGYILKILAMTPVKIELGLLASPRLL